MTAYVDTYVSGPVQADLETFAGNFTNFIPSQPGISAQPAGTNAEGPTPAVVGAGDPDLFYTCIRATFDITPLVVSPLAVVDSTTGAAIVGVWA